MTDVFEDINKFATACDQEPSKENYDMYLNLIREEMDELEEAINTIKSVQKKIGFKSIISDSDVAKISVIGIGMKTQAGVAQKMFDVLAEKNINLKVISTSEIKISVLIEAPYMELAARSLHTAFNLDESN